MTQKKIPKRSDVPESNKWDLTPLFDSDGSWETFFAETENKMSGYQRYKGHLAESAQLLGNAIGFHMSVSRSIEKLYTYAHLKSDEDKSGQYYLGLFQRGLSLYTRAGEISSFITPEIQNIEESVIQQYLSEEVLNEYRFYLKKILRYKPHTHDEKIEQILAMSQDQAQASSQIFSQLDNVDLKFGSIADDSGTSVELSHGNFSTFLIHPDREIRKKAFKQYYMEYNDHKNSIAAALTYSNKKDLFYARVRNLKIADQPLYSRTMCRKMSMITLLRRSKRIWNHCLSISASANRFLGLMSCIFMIPMSR